MGFHPHAAVYDTIKFGCLMWTTLCLLCGPLLCVLLQWSENCTLQKSKGEIIYNLLCTHVTLFSRCTQIHFK